jgi:hypothetical protein
MSKQSRSALLKRTGLNIDQIISPAGDMAPVPTTNVISKTAITMVNDVRVSRWAQPSVAVATGWMEVIELVQNDDLLTLTSLAGRSEDGVSTRVQRYAQRTVSFQGAATYMFLSILPTGANAATFRPAVGTAVVLAATCCSNTRLVLRASLVDTDPDAIGDHVHGLIFNATQV